MWFGSVFSVLFSFLMMGQAFSETVSIERQCDGYSVRGDVETNSRGNRIYHLSMVDEQQRKVPIKTVYGLYFKAACVHDASGEPYVLLWQCYGGSASPENVYGLFHVSSKRLWIDPDKYPWGNTEILQKILGYAPQDVPDERYFFTWRL